MSPEFPPQSSANAPLTEAGKQYHIELSPGEISRYVLIPGDRGRVDRIASVWDAGTARLVADHREYRTMNGDIGGVPITCTSSGIGGPAISIAVDELSRVGADTFIRVGSCGSIQSGQNLGDLVISTGAVRLDGASQDMVMLGYPAVANYEVVMALIQAARNLDMPHHVGITASTDTFYSGQGRVSDDGYLPSHKQHILSDLQAAGVRNFEMEAATLFAQSGIAGKRAGAICFVVADRVGDQGFSNEEWMAVRAAKVASEAVRVLAGWDQLKAEAGVPHFYPGLVRP